MTVATETGYTWTDGKHARLLHAGNAFPIKDVTATEDSGSTADLVLNGLTRDRWVPFANEVASPADLSSDDWSSSNIEVGADGQTLSEGTATGFHQITQTGLTVTADEWVVSVEVERQELEWLVLQCQDSAPTGFFAYFNISEKEVGSTTGGGAVGSVVDLGGGKALLSIKFTPVSGSASVAILTADADGTVNYTGTDRTVKVLNFSAHKSDASLRLDTFGAQAGSCFAIGAHNLWSSGATITFEHDSDADDTWTAIGTATPTNDGPIMFFFDAVTSGRWRVSISGGALPEIGVVRIGDPLTFERPFYSGFTPARMNRATELVGNVSRTGELLGRSKRRTILSENISFQHLTYDWVRANLDGPSGVIQSLEADSAFFAWRPELTQDVAYIMRASTTVPAAMGVRDLWTFGINAEVYSYE